MYKAVKCHNSLVASLEVSLFILPFPSCDGLLVFQHLGEKILKITSIAENIEYRSGVTLLILMVVSLSAMYLLRHSVRSHVMREMRRQLMLAFAVDILCFCM